MRCRAVSGVVMAGILGSVAAAQAAAQTSTLPPVTVQDCTRLKGSAKKTCVASAAQSNPPAPAATPEKKGSPDPFPFPEDQSKQNKVPGATADMPTGEPDPPSQSMKPMHVPGADADPPAGSSSSSSSSSSTSGDAVPAPPPKDEDAAPTTSASDTPVRPGTLKNLGSRVDSTEARRKLEQTRVEDDLRVGRFYFKDGDYAGATSRYKDALSHDADNPDAHFGLAQVLLKQNKPADATLHLERYLQLAPDDEHTADAKKMLAKLKR